jgi:cytochrome c-type biogenesis protein CcmH
VAVLVVVAVALVVGTRSGPSHQTLNQRTLDIAGQVRCPACDGESAAQSDVAASVEIRTIIRQQLQAGFSQKQILDDLVASYGPGILEKPQTKGINFLVWSLPVAIGAVALGGLALAFRRWRPASRAVVTEADRDLVSDALTVSNSTAGHGDESGSPGESGNGTQGDGGRPDGGGVPPSVAEGASIP